MKVQVHEDIYNILQFIRDNFKVDMRDVREVAHLCELYRHPGVSLWIAMNRKKYLKGVRYGFEPKKTE